MKQKRRKWQKTISTKSILMIVKQIHRKIPKGKLSLGASLKMNGEKTLAETAHASRYFRYWVSHTYWVVNFSGFQI